MSGEAILDLRSRARFVVRTGRQKPHCEYVLTLGEEKPESRNTQILLIDYLNSVHGTVGY